MNLSDKEYTRKYIRQIMQKDVGMDGQKRILNASVSIVGAGGLGTPVALYLAAAGVGTISLIDFDTISITNLHRQVLYGDTDVGSKKIAVAAARLKTLHPSCVVNEVDEMVNQENAEILLSGCDVVVDGCDNFATRYVVNDACLKLGKPLVYGSILDFEGQVAVFNHGNSKNLRDIFPEPPLPEEVPDCAENGVLATVPGIIGLMMAQEALKVILGKCEPSGTYHIIDTFHFNQRSIRY